MPKAKKNSSRGGKMMAVKKAPQELKKVATKPGAAQTVAKGAAGIALAATAVAAGAALTSKTYRKEILKGAEQIFETLKDTASETYENGQQRMQAVTHTVGKKSSRSTARSKKGKK